MKSYLKKTNPREEEEDSVKTHIVLNNGREYLLDTFPMFDAEIGMTIVSTSDTEFMLIPIREIKDITVSKVAEFH